MRLDKFITHATSMSRSQVKQSIKQGNVSVNGNIVSDAGLKVSENSDVICLHHQPLSPPQARYFMINKPAGYVCANSDAEHPIVLDLLSEPNIHQLRIAGRLDKDTTGLVLLTDDGQWNHAITSPKRDCFKVYHVTVAEPLSPSIIEDFEKGILLQDEQKRREKKQTRPAKLDIIDPFHAVLSIQEGKYHQVKRMFAAMGNQVTHLHRSQVGDIVLAPSLREGHYRPLTKEEINSVYA